MSGTDDRDMCENVYKVMDDFASSEKDRMTGILSMIAQVLAGSTRDIKDGMLVSALLYTIMLRAALLSGYAVCRSEKGHKECIEELGLFTSCTVSSVYYEVVDLVQRAVSDKVNLEGPVDNIKELYELIGKTLESLSNEVMNIKGPREEMFM